MRVGIEIGGTFTDLVRIDDRGIRIVKVRSTPAAPDAGLFDAVEAGGIDLEAVRDFAHGSTVATNAVLERKGGRIALLVTEGFRDILLLRRQDREALFDIFYRKPEPLVPRSDTLEVPERVGSGGDVVRALDEDALVPRLEAFLRDGGYDAVAICLLNAFARPDHERRVAELVRRIAPDLPVTCSVDVSRAFREYERASTATLAAYVQPVLDAYLRRIEARLDGSGFRGAFSMMQSNGGRVPAAAIRSNGASALLSGPAAGVTGAIRQSARSGVRDIITLDIGGTSADVCLIRDGRPDLTKEARIDTLPVLVPMVDITTIGAGGGSLVWIDDGGLLRVGPRSAGADPGPACYGRGGTAPTLTDAHVVCGRINPDAKLAGSLPLDAAAARRAFEPIAETLGLSVEEVASSAIRIAVEAIVSAIRLVSTSRGRDPRDYVLVPFGGAGPLHAALVADALAMDRVLIPPNAGVLSAYGLLVADYSVYDGVTRRRRLEEEAMPDVRATIAELLEGLTRRADELGLGPDRRFDVILEMRFVGQAYDLGVPIDLAALDELKASDLVAAFVREHEIVYRHGGLGAVKSVEIVSFQAGLHVAPETVPSLADVAEAEAAIPTIGARIYDEGRWHETSRQARSAVADGIRGPVALEDLTATVYVPPGWTAASDEAGNLTLRRVA
ncbi:hydantoinase/oxoprolinase family protein [Enterovirga rhinocerotis]|uniref:N-methylhydantoinase A n=1 Tax=Enterovirga rhinocerotis TaxID=1339210 RepID=A0A4R7BY93_9HYPH|nr:hydantoinase/oxoprolinase family protein [Enterovirga rhinocerotis]TDR90222.1 N-methylhydantoinase A [Enterovirga rhinocerotis]